MLESQISLLKTDKAQVAAEMNAINQVRSDRIMMTFINYLVTSNAAHIACALRLQRMW